MAAFQVDFRGNVPEKKCDPFVQFSGHFNEIIDEISQLDLTQAQANIIHKTFEKLCGASCELIKMLCSENIIHSLNMIQ